MGTIIANAAHWSRLLNPESAPSLLRRDMGYPVSPVEGDEPCPEDVRTAARILMRQRANAGDWPALLLDQDLDAFNWMLLGGDVKDGLVSILLPVRGAHECLDRCLESLVAHTNPEDYELIVACCEEERAAISAILCRHGNLGVLATMVVSEEPMGFPAAINAAAHMATGSIYCFLNSDAYVTPNWLGGLLRTLKANPHVAAVGPCGTNVSGEQNSADVLARAREVSAEQVEDGIVTQSWVVEGGAEFNRPPSIDEIRAAAREWRKGKDWQRSHYVDRLVGFCLLVQASAFWRAGALWEGFGLGNFDDDDLSIRLLMLEHRLVLNERVLVLHQMSASFKELAEREGDPHLYSDLLQKNFVNFERRWGWCARELRKLREEAKRGPAL